MITAIRRRLSIRSKDAGITLIELMVAMIVFGILSAIVVSLYTAANKSVLSTSNNDQNTQAAGNAMAELTRVIRGATTNPLTGGKESPAIITAGANTLSLYSYVDSSALTTSPVYVQFTASTATNNLLVEKRWNAAVDVNGLFTFDTTKAPNLTRNFPGKLDSTKLFSYLDDDGAPTVSLPDIAAITVNLISQSSLDPNVKPATLRNTVGLPNVTLEANN